MKNLHIILSVQSALIFLLSSSGVKAQSEDTSLQKYSYHIIGFIDEKPSVGGTAFFVKYKSKFFLVSAWHCFSFKDIFAETYDNPNQRNINTVIVYRNVSEIRPGKFIFISLFDSIGQSPLYAEQRENDTLLDISTIEVVRSPPFLFDYIPLTDVSKKMASTHDSVVYYGFPVISGTQVNISQGFQGQVVETMDRRREFNVNMSGHSGCSGSPVFKIASDGPHLQGVLFYALKDISGDAFECRAVDINWLFKLFHKTPPYHAWNFHTTYLSLKRPQ